VTVGCHFTKPDMDSHRLTILGAFMPIEIRRKDVKTLVGQDRAQLVEVLPADEYKREHLPKAINIPLQEITPENTRQLKKDQAVIVYCANYLCDLSARAAWRLESMGFQEVYRYTPGKEDWVASGYETEGTTAGRTRLKKYLKTNVQTCLLRDRMQDVQNRRGSSDICVVLNDRNIVMGVIQGEAWNANPLSRASEAMIPGPPTFRPDGEPRLILKELRAQEISSAIVTSSDGELLGVLRVSLKKDKRHKPPKPQAA
jgi:rhodanese-related sulfurtransferase